MRLGVLTGGGDCPGLNAVIRSVVFSSSSAHGDEVVGFLDGWRGVLDDRTVALDPDDCGGLLPRGGTVLGTSRTNPFATDGGPERAVSVLTGLGVDAVIAIGGDDTLGVAARLGPLGVRAGRSAQDHRQRPVGHRGDIRLRHGRADRHRGDRPPADHGRVPPPGHRLRGDGAQRGVDRHLRRHRRGRGRDPGARAPLRPRRRVRPPHPPPRAGSVLLGGGGVRGGPPGRRPRRRRRPAGHLPQVGRRLRPRPPGGDRHLAGRRDRGRGPASSPGSPRSVTSSGAGRPPPTTGCWPPASGRPPWPPCTTATSPPWWPCRRGGSSASLSRTAVGAPKTLDLSLLADVAGPCLD